MKEREISPTESYDCNGCNDETDFSHRRFLEFLDHPFENELGASTHMKGCIPPALMDANRHAACPRQSCPRQSCPPQRCPVWPFKKENRPDDSWCKPLLG